jgi:hypothetical protein
MRISGFNLMSKRGWFRPHGIRDFDKDLITVISKASYLQGVNSFINNINLNK